MGKGSCSIDYRLLERAGIREFQHIEIYDVENGERLMTYGISSQEQGEICLETPPRRVNRPVSRAAR